MKLIRLLFKINWWYTLYINFKSFSVSKAVKFPIWIFGKVDVQSLTGAIIINRIPFPGMIRIGDSSVGIFDRSLRSVLNVHGELVFNGSANIGRGSSLSIGPNAKLILGNKFKITAKSSIISSGGKSVIIGENCVLSWGIQIINTDFHKILDKDTLEIINSPNDIVIGDHVWIGLGVTILKGVILPSNCVVAANSTVTACFIAENSIYAGTPAKLVKSNIDWKG